MPTLNSPGDTRLETIVSAELHAVVQRVTTGRSLDDVLVAVLEAVESLLGAASSTIILTQYDGSPSRERFTTRQTGRPHWDARANTRRTASPGKFLRRARRSRSAMRASIPEPRPWSSPVDRAFVAVPIRYAENNVGVLYVNWWEPRQFGASEIALLETIATYGAIAIENARLRRQENLARREAEELQQRLQRFVATVAHDLEGPLTLVVAYSELLRRSTPPERLEVAARALPGMDRAARRIQRLVHDLHAVARIGASRLEVVPSRIDLCELLGAIVADLQGTTANHQLAVEGPTSLLGEWDSAQISEAFTNLVSNAIRYSVDGGPVRIVVDEAGDLVIVRVVDQGIGISADQIPRLFQPFSQLSPEPTTDGAGLGLYIAKAIIELHGGKIWAKSELEKGSTFTVALPRWQNLRRTH